MLNRPGLFTYKTMRTPLPKGTLLRVRPGGSAIGNTSWTLTPVAEERLRLVCASIKLVTDATVADRTVILSLYDGATTLLASMGDVVPQPASETVTHFFVPGTTAGVDAGTSHYHVCPHVQIWENLSLKVGFSGAVVGDTSSDVEAVWEVI